MLPFVTSIVALAGVLAAGLAAPNPPIVSSSTCAAAAARCTFRFAGRPYLPTFDIDPAYPDRPFTPRIQSKTAHLNLGILNAAAPVQLILPAGARPLHDFGHPRFPSSFFKPFPAGPRHRVSALGFQSVNGRQLQALDGACVRVFFSNFQELDGKGHVIGNHNQVPMSERRCVVFRAVVRSGLGSSGRSPAPVFSPRVSTIPIVPSVVGTATPHPSSASTTPPGRTMAGTPVTFPPTPTMISVPPVPSTVPMTPDPTQAVTPDPSKNPPTPRPIKPSPIIPASTTESPLPEPSRRPIVKSITIKPGTDVSVDQIHVNQKLTFKVDLSSLAEKTDIYFLTDATTSMAGAISAVRTRFTDIVSNFQNRTDAHFGIGFYRDEADRLVGEGFMNMQKITSNIPDVKKAISNLDVGGSPNPDIEEANLLALYKVATDSQIGWRDDARKIVVWSGDAPGHEPTCVGKKRLNREKVIMELRKKGITVIGVTVNPFNLFNFNVNRLAGLDAPPTTHYDGECTAVDNPVGKAGQGTNITTATGGGKVVEVDKPTEIVDRIIAATNTVVRRLDLDASDCGTAVELSSSPTLPITLKPGQKQTIMQNVVVRSEACAKNKTFSCTLKYTESGAALKPVVLRLKKIEGCK